MNANRPSRTAVASLLLLASLIASPLLAAQEANSSESDDELFGDAALVTVPTETAKDIAGAGFETSKGLLFGGDLSLVQSVDLWNGNLSQAKGMRTQNLGLNFDARPSDSFRVYGRGQYTMTNAVMDGTFSIQELFADVSWNRTVNLRVGKQAANWGVGYWWSPADILSLSAIDQSDPSARRAGPVAIKASMPIGLNQASIYATTDATDNIDQIGLAGRFEFVLGDSEFGLGGYYRRDDEVKPRLVGTATVKFLGVNWYGEAVGSFGSEVPTVSFASGSPVVSTRDDFLFQGAAGFTWTATDQEKRWNIVAMGEYYFNGRGAEDAAAYADHRAQLLGLVAGGALGGSDLLGYGRHYAGLYASAEDLWSSGLGLVAEWRSNLADASGYGRLVAVYEPVADFRAEAGGEIHYGPDGGEYVFMNGTGEAGYAVASLRLWTRTTIDVAYPLYGEGARPRLTLVVSGRF